MKTNFVAKTPAWAFEWWRIQDDTWEKVKNAVIDGIVEKKRW